MSTHQVKTSFASGLSFVAHIDQYTVPMDTTEEGSQQAGPSPKKLMLASLAGCTGIDVVSILHKMKVDFSQFSIDVEAELTEEHPKIYKAVVVTYTIQVAEADRPKVEKAVALSQEKYCGVNAMFQSFCRVTSRIVYC